MKQSKDIYRLIKNYSNPRYTFFAYGLIMSMISSIISIFMTYYVKYIINGISDAISIKKYIFTFIIFILMNILCSAVSDFLLNIFGYGIVKDLRISIFDHVIRLNQEFYDEHSSGEISSHIISDTSMLSYLVSDIIPESINGIITIIFSLIMMFYLSANLTIAIVIIFPVLLLFIYPLLRWNEKISKKIQYRNANLISDMTVINDNSIITKSYNAQSSLSNTISKKIDGIFELNKQQAIIGSLVNPIISIALTFVIVMIVVYGIYLVIKHRITVGTLGSYLLFLIQLNAPMINIVSLLNNISQSIGATSEIIKYLDLKKENIKSGIYLKSKINKIEFDNVCFKYHNHDNYILKNINLKLKKGEKLAIVGESGSGKSSLIKLLMKIYDITQGYIYINGISISDINTSDLRSKIAYVSQNSYIYNDSFIKNIFLSDDVKMDDLNTLLSYLNLTNIIDDYEKNINSSLFSGGENQRIGILRSLMKEADVYIFDEVTSNLDRNNSNKIMKIIDELSKDKIVIMITHDYSILDGSEMILNIN